MEAYDRLVRLVQEAADDVQKADGGNKAAGTRVRKAMQDIKNVAQEVRKDVLQSRDAGAAAGGAAPQPQAGGAKPGGQFGR